MNIDIQCDLKIQMTSKLIVDKFTKLIEGNILINKLKLKLRILFQWILLQIGAALPKRFAIQCF